MRVESEIMPGLFVTRAPLPPARDKEEAKTPGENREEFVGLILRNNDTE